MNPILENIQFAVENSKLVSIQSEKIKDFCNNMDHTHIKHWLGEAPIDLSRLNDEEKLNFMMVFNSMSFSYWGEPKWTVEYKGSKYDGAWAMVCCIFIAIHSSVMGGFP